MDVIAKTYTTSGIFLKIDHTTATASGPNKALKCERLTPIKRGALGQTVGYAYLLEDTPTKVVFKLFIDYSTPERLDLENGLEMYLKLYASNDMLDYVELDFKGNSLPIGTAW